MRPASPEPSRVLPYCRSALASQRLSNFGPLVAQLEERLADLLKVDRNSVTTVANATLGLQGILANVDAPSSAVIGVQSWTFPAPVSVAVASPYDVVLCDVSLDTWRVKVDEGADIQIDVLPFGDGLALGPSSWRTFTVVDAAASLPTLIQEGIPSSPGPFALVCSLHTTKAISGAEGGIVYSNDTQLIKNIRRWSNFGFDSNRSAQRLGTNAKMSEMDAAVALAALDEWSLTEEKLLKQTRRALRTSTKIGVGVAPSLTKERVTPYWVLKLANSKEVKLLERLAEKALIETRHWWASGCHVMPPFSHLAKHELGSTEELARTTIALPFWRDLSDAEWTRLENLLEDFKSAK